MVRKTVDEAIKKLRAAWTGKEVRDRMADTIEAINDEVIDTTSKQEKLNTKFNDLIINAGNSNAEVATARKGHATVGDRLDEFDSQLDTMVNERKNKYFVGGNYPYKTITEAINKWKLDGQPKAEIYLSEGEFNDIVSIDTGKEISFFGSGKKLTTWRTTTGKYKDAPITARGGKIILEGITIIADHSSIGDNYDYIGYPDGSGNGKYQNAYAVHFDSGNGGYYLIKDCDLISYQDASLGCGTMDNTTIRLENVNLFSYTDSADTHPNAGIESLNHGALLYHTCADGGTPTLFESLELINVNIYSKNSPYPFFYKNYSTDGSKKHFFAKNLSISGDNVTKLFMETTRNAETKPYYILNKNSFGNNFEDLNYIKSGANLGLNSDGMAEFIEDCNNISKCGFYYSRTNAPTSGYYFINHIQYGKFAYQEAKLLDNSVYYSREKINDVWGDWKAITNTETSIQNLIMTMINVGTNGRCTQVSEIDNIRKCGYFIVPNTVSGLPERKYYAMHSIAANSGGAIQQIWDLETGTSYKRLCYNNTWTSWVEY